MSQAKDETDSRLDRLLGRLPREIDPGTDLWPAIETAIRRQNNDAERRLAELPRDVAPPADLWPRIAAAITGDSRTGPGSRRGRRGGLPLAAAAALLASVATVLVGTRLFGTLDEVVETEATYAGVSGVLSPRFLDAGPPAGTAMGAAFADARRVFADQIAAVRAERESIEASLTLYPDQPTLLAEWLHTYETELLLIDEANRVLTGIRTGWHS